MCRRRHRPHSRRARASSLSIRFIFIVIFCRMEIVIGSPMGKNTQKIVILNGRAHNILFFCNVYVGIILYIERFMIIRKRDAYTITRE